ncbi:ORF113 [Xestia c-nigrum granulovirus]|uniref:ORF113 n=1 Tax=Xestia c-nigrum granulosis virus TaxID=51677 RepID=Q9PYT1_GVXN|nr:ORF113 [Xestia c-nigrum granulovirus]AAF05227.1 ORF113 [Xestia c-nigrum granulovirus]
MPLIFYEDTLPVDMLTFGATVYYFKLRHLAAVLRKPCVTIVSKIPPRYVVTYNIIVDQYPDCKQKCHPTTKYVRLEGVKYLIDEFCVTNYTKDCFDKFIRQNVDVPNYKRLSSDYTFEDTEDLCDEEKYDNADNKTTTNNDCEPTQIRMGTLKYNNRFVMVMGPKKRWYYKASDLFDYMKANCVYNINKYVSDKNIVKWRDLKHYLEEKYRCRIDDGDFKPNSFFLKQAGLKQLLLARKQNVLYNAICLSAINYNFENPVKYVNKRGASRKKQVYADQCEVGKRYNRIDYVKLPNGKVWYKLSQCINYFKLKNVQLYDYKIKQWADLLCDLQKHNIKWKTTIRMIEGAELYRMLNDYSLPLEADQIYFHAKNP